MKHLLYLLLAGSLLTEQPLYGAKKKNKKTKKITKKGKKGGTSSAVATTIQPVTSTPTQTTKTETPQTAIMTKQHAQKLIDGYLEKYRKDILVPIINMMTKLETNLKSDQLKNLVKARSKKLLNIDEKIKDKIVNLITIFTDKNDIDFDKANDLKNEFNKIVEELKNDFPNKIKENKTEEQKIVKTLDENIKSKFNEMLKKTNKEEKQTLQAEMATLEKEKKTIKEHYPQFMETILTIHKEALSLFENDILKDFLKKLIKEDSDKKIKAAYNTAKEKRYTDKITDKKNKQREENEKINKELEEKIKSEQDPKKKEELKRELKRELNRRKVKKATINFGETSKAAEKIDSKEREAIKKSLLEFKKSTEMQKIDKLNNKNQEGQEKAKLEDFKKKITELNKKHDTLKTQEDLKEYMREVLKATGLIDATVQISSNESKNILMSMLISLEKSANKNSPYSKTIEEIMKKIESFNPNDEEENKKIAHQNIYKVIDNIKSEKGKNFFNKKS